MLIWFRFKNFGPFREEAFFDMRAVDEYKELPDHVMRAGNQNVVRTAAIYGANASGKSNFINALKRFVGIIRNSMVNNNDNKLSAVDVISENKLINYYYPFRFDPSNKKKPTEFEAAVSIFDREYQYGYVYDDSKIWYEWLYETPKNGEQVVIFTRDKEQKVQFGESVSREECEKYISGLQEQVLLLTFFNQIKLSDDVWRYANLSLTSLLAWEIGSVSWSMRWINTRINTELQYPQKKQELMRFLKQIDVNIIDFDITETDGKIVQIYTIHEDNAGNRYRMPIEQESNGTIKALALYLIVGDKLEYEITFIFDEMNAHLHPLLTKYFVDRFYSKDANEQLIFATHDTNLLDKRYMRRDQVWFVEKKGNEAELFSLAEFKAQENASFRKNYLSGNYGAIPILGEFDE